MTVEWCLPPKLLPISGSDAVVRALQRYIATWRGSATDFELFLDFRSDQLQVVVVRHELLNHVDRDGALLVPQDVPQHLLRERHRDVAAGQRRVGEQPDERSFELPDVRLDAAGDVERHVVGQLDALGLGLALEDRDLRLEIRRLDVGDEAPFEAAAQALLESLIWCGGQSLLSTICFCASCSALNVWKNSVCVRSLPTMNWMSSTSSTSTPR